MYHLITILLIVLGLFSVDRVSFSCFLPREAPLAFIVKLVWLCWTLLTFACLETFWFLYQIWRRVLLGGVLLVVGSFLSSLKIWHAIPFWLIVSVEKSIESLMGIPLCVICRFSLAAFNILSLSLIFISLIAMCFGVLPWVYPSWDSVLPGLSWLFPFPC